MVKLKDKLYHEQDLFKMGGLRTKMPITYANFWMGSLAIIGIFPFAGFYSKDLVLESAYKAGGVGNFAFILGIIAAVLTAVYSLKIIMLVFHGETKLTKQAFEHVHESPKIMNVPLLALSAGTLFAGMIGYYILGISSPYGFFVRSIFNLNISEHEYHVLQIIEMLPLIVGVAGMLIGYYIYKSSIHSIIADKMKVTYYILKNKFFFDELFELIFIRPTRILSCLARTIDVKLIDRFGPNGFGVATKGASWCICQVQTGYIFNYAFYIVFALVVCITVFVAQYLYGAWGI